MDTTKLQSAIDDLVAEATRTEGTEDSAAIIISGIANQISVAVAAALAADTAANQGSIDAATAAIAAVKERFLAADDKLGAAIAANAGGATA